MSAPSTFNLTLNNQFTHKLPADSDSNNYVRQVEQACYSFVAPKQTLAPQLIIHSPDVARRIGLAENSFESDEFAQVFIGNQLLADTQPWACCYGGHQFGQWAGQLGDGRAINLTEVMGTEQQHWTLQLKGAGPTPYSRTADGLAVLRSSVREFLCSEAMHHLGVATTRALSLCLSGDKVMRDMFYDGNAALESGAVVCRVAESFTRFGSFQIFASRGDIDNLKRLADYTIERDFPQHSELLQRDPKQAYLNWFQDVCNSTCDMIVGWMRVGFVHGVMNTDNMSILGQTIDYGPYGWIDNFDPEWTPNTTDSTHKRYRFGNQAAIAQWNLLQLANAIYPLIDSSEELEQQLHQFRRDYDKRWLNMMRDKLGLTSAQDEDLEFIQELEQLLHQCQLDMTVFYRQLMAINAETSEHDLINTLEPAFYQLDSVNQNTIKQLQRWLQDYQIRLSMDSNSEPSRQQLMAVNNPVYVLRNYLAQEAIDLANSGDYGMIHELFDCLQQPYTEQPQYARFASKRPDWAKQKAGCSMLSCSS